MNEIMPTDASSRIGLAETNTAGSRFLLNRTPQAMQCGGVPDPLKAAKAAAATRRAKKMPVMAFVPEVSRRPDVDGKQAVLGLVEQPLMRGVVIGQ